MEVSNKSVKNKPAISVITATYNAAADLPILIDSLKQQTNGDFEWVIADGGSKDGTLDLISAVDDLPIQLSTEPDFGIYDALNRAIQLSSADHYIVIGADDYFFKDAVDNIINELQEGQVDFLVGMVESEGSLIKVHTGRSFIYGARAFVASHSVGCVIKKKLHNQFGLYTNQYPILADSYFIKQVFKSQSATIKYSTKIFGNFSAKGMSRTNGLKTQCEFGHIQMTTERFKFIQACLLFVRVIKELVLAK